MFWVQHQENPDGHTGRKHEWKNEWKKKETVAEQLGWLRKLHRVGADLIVNMLKQVYGFTVQVLQAIWNESTCRQLE